MPEETLTVGALAEAADVNPQTVRYYERRGLLPEPPRSPAGYRRYDIEDVRRLRFIKHAQEVGFTLREIDDLLSLRIDTHASRDEARRLAEAKIDEIDARIARLRQMRRALDRLVGACHAEAPESACPILEALDDDAFTVE